MKCNRCRKEYPKPDLVDGVAYFVCLACGDLHEMGNYEAYLEVKAIFDVFTSGLEGDTPNIDFRKVGEALYQYEKLRDDRCFWAYEVWGYLNSWELQQQYLIGAIDIAAMDDLDYLGGIGADPLEGLIAEQVIDFISNLRCRGVGRDTEFDRKLCISLQMYRFDPEGDGLSGAEARLIDYIKYHYPNFSDDGMFHLN